MSIYFLVMATGFLGSFHCAVMCGPFAVIAQGRTGQAGNQLAYQGGRLMAYLGLGGLAGALGQSVLFAGAAVGMQKGLMVLMGCAMILSGLAYYLPKRPSGRWHLALGRFIRRLSEAVTGRERAAVMGLLTTLMPCGFLYAYALAAFSSGSALRGLVTMACFWVGTAPALLTVSYAAGFCAGRLPQRLVQITPIFLVLLGILALVGKWTALPGGPDQDFFCFSPK